MIHRYRFTALHQAPRLLHSLLEKHANEKPLDPHCVVVPSLDYANWLNLKLAEQGREHISANINYFQLSEFLELWSESNNAAEASFTWSKQVIQMALFHLLPQFREQHPNLFSTFSPETLADEIKRFRLAGQMADAFDKYHVYRPEWLLKWSQSTPYSDQPNQIKQQAMLWHRLCSRFPSIKDYLHRHWSHAPSNPPPEQLPALHFYFVSLPAIPNSVAKFLNTVLKQDSRTFHLLEWHPSLPVTNAQMQLHFEGATEHQPLQKWNRQRSEYAQLARRYFGNTSGQVTDERPEAGNNLQHLQQQFINPHPQEHAFEQQDDSFQIHACYNARREAEVLHEQLLACFERLPSLRPDDILIVTPDLETYGPVLHSVLSHPGDAELELPHHFSDPTHNPRAELAGQFIQLLRTAAGRFKVSEITELISLPAIRQAMALTETDVAQIEQWLIELNIRWGFDTSHRTNELHKLDSSTRYKTEQNSWQQGLDRLWMGFSTRLAENTFPHQCLPCSNVEGSHHHHLLGQLYHFLQQLWECHHFVAREHSLKRWAEKLLELISQRLEPDEAELPHLQWLREQVTRLEEWTPFYPESVRFGIITDILKDILLQNRFGITRMNGFTVISSMVPVRAIPFKVIAMMGLNEGSFPGIEPDNPFDLLQHDYQPGDRSRKLEDRQLFWDFIMAAEDHLIITYTGFDERSNETLPPSSLVAELLYAMVDSRTAEIEESHHIMRHPLHAFSATGTTYLSSRKKLAERLAKTCDTISSFTEFKGLNTLINWEAAGENGKPDSPISLSDVIRFYSHPAKYYCTHYLKIWLREPELADEDYEPFSLDSLAKYHLLDHELQKMLTNPRYAPSLLPYKQAGELPHGLMGQQAWREQITVLESQRAAVFEELACDQITDPLSITFSLQMGDELLTLEGESSFIADKRQLIIKTGGSIKAKDRLKAWILHLSMQLAGHAVETGLWGVGTNNSFQCQHQFPAFENKQQAENHLRMLIRGYGIGQQHLLGLFPKSSWAWAESYWSDRESKASDEDKALQAARDAYYNPDSYYAFSNENNDPWYWYLFRNINPYDNNEQAELLIKTARQIWQPLMEIGT